jgi:hypothetical protein
VTKRLPCRFGKSQEEEEEKKENGDGFGDRREW